MKSSDVKSLSDIFRRKSAPSSGPLIRPGTRGAWKLPRCSPRHLISDAYENADVWVQESSSDGAARGDQIHVEYSAGGVERATKGESDKSLQRMTCSQRSRAPDRRCCRQIHVRPPKILKERGNAAPSPHLRRPGEDGCGGAQAWIWMDEGLSCNRPPNGWIRSPLAATCFHRQRQHAV